jgi:hypothetical protein
LVNIDICGTSLKLKRRQLMRGSWTKAWKIGEPDWLTLLSFQQTRIYIFLLTLYWKPNQYNNQLETFTFFLPWTGYNYLNTINFL